MVTETAGGKGKEKCPRYRHKNQLSEQSSRSPGNKSPTWQVDESKSQHSKGNTHTSEQQPAAWVKIFANYTCDRGLTSSIYKEPQKSNNKDKAKLTNESLANELDSFQKKKYKWTKYTWKQFNISRHQGNANKNHFAMSDRWLWLRK